MGRHPLIEVHKTPIRSMHIIIKLKSHLAVAITGMPS